MAKGIDFTVPALKGFNQAAFEAPARNLLQTAPHVFTDRSYRLEDIETIIDSYASREINLSAGTLSLAMDLADAQWEIIKRTDVESVINITDRLCFDIPKTDAAKTEQGKQLLEEYWAIYEAAKTVRGIKKGQADKSENVVNINALRSELNAFRGTYTCYSAKDTEGIETDVNNLWLPPVRAAAERYRKSIRENGKNHKEFNLI